MKLLWGCGQADGTVVTVDSSGGWLCNAIECKDAEALLFAVAWIAGPAVIFFLAGLWQVRKKNKAKKQAEKFIENWAKFKIEKDKAS